MNMIKTVQTELTWYSALQYAPDAGCPVLIVTLADEGFAVSMAEIGLADGEWRCTFDGSRLDPDDIELWAEISVPKFHT